MDDALRYVIGGSNLFCALLIGGLAVPLIRGRIGPNRTYGVRTRAAFASEEAWYAINRFGGRELLRWSVPVALVGLAAFVFSGLGAKTLIASAFVPIVYLVPCWRMHRFSARWTPEE